MLLRLFILFLLLPSARAWGEPLRDPSKLINPQPRQMAKLANARVVVADYQLLREDFKQLRTLTDRQIDEVLLREAGYVRASQTGDFGVNTKIATTAERKVGLRPNAYGRAAVLPFLDGLIDSKGSGTDAPQDKSHGNGLATLAEALREFAYEKTVRRLLQGLGWKNPTVRTYAVLDPGFDQIADGKESPAGIVLRQAHERSHPLGSVRDARSTELERLLRRFGITSDMEGVRKYPDTNTLDRHNLQVAKDGRIFDFGAFHVAADFGKSSPVQPDARHALSPEIWGYDPTHPFDRVWEKFDEIGRRFRKKEISQAEIETEMRHLISSVQRPPAYLRPPSPCDIFSLAS